MCERCRCCWWSPCWRSPRCPSPGTTSSTGRATSGRSTWRSTARRRARCSTGVRSTARSPSRRSCCRSPTRRSRRSSRCRWPRCPFHVAGWLWTALQVAATYATVLIAFRAAARALRDVALGGRGRRHGAAAVPAPGVGRRPVRAGQRVPRAGLPRRRRGGAHAGPPLARAAWALGRAGDGGEADARGVLRALRGVPAVARPADGGARGRGGDRGRLPRAARRRRSRSGAAR